MNIETLQQYCLTKKGVTESLPFGPETLVYKVGGKMFLLAALDAIPLQFSVKCDPELAILLRDAYPAVLPGYHMSKKHWNTVLVDGSVGTDLLEQWIDASYEIVIDSLPSKIKKEILL